MSVWKLLIHFSGWFFYFWFWGSNNNLRTSYMPVNIFSILSQKSPSAWSNLQGEMKCAWYHFQISHVLLGFFQPTTVTTRWRQWATCHRMPVQRATTALSRQSATTSTPVHPAPSTTSLIAPTPLSARPACRVTTARVWALLHQRASATQGRQWKKMKENADMKWRQLCLNTKKERERERNGCPKAGGKMTFS